MNFPETLRIDALFDWAELGASLFTYGMLVGVLVFYGAVLYVAHATMRRRDDIHRTHRLRHP